MAFQHSWAVPSHRGPRFVTLSTVSTLALYSLYSNFQWNSRCWCLKISARNRFEELLKPLEEGVVTATVKIKVNGPVTITAIISKEAVEDLKLQRGNHTAAVIKATEVMVSQRLEAKYPGKV